MSGVGVAVATLAYGEIATLALIEVAAEDSEWYDHTVADLQTLCCPTHPDDLAHELVAHDVAA